MQVPIIKQDNSEKGKKEVPKQFLEPVRADLIKRAVEAIQSHNRQPYGAHPEAGQRHSAELSRRRHNYRGSYGFGISRVPRKIHTRRGTRFFWVGAVSPGCVGGRRAHPPKAEKIWSKKLNINERRKAIRSALAATMIKEEVVERGHKLPDNYPFILDSSFESIEKTKDFKSILEKIGLKDELVRASRKTYRAGKARLRGRKYKKAKGPLVVVSGDCALVKSGINIPGIDVVDVKNLNAELLAPGADIGRLTLFTEGSFDKLTNDNLFMNKINRKKLVKKTVEPTKKETKKSKLKSSSKTKKAKVEKAEIKE
ncbi:50S ribosomal protein L4 [Candidatus Woesearchaeota archaeon]|jgi:large subunit ribosomal protein L4e|nr:50S ribosomal protein L4 [Candidatus Woesearchaeota archaeon]MBT6520318.1 50S ribosomal protein L4 [Candidatus Woesearchaeota archaeon]MBT7368271.1 50S ribosomal protein L4 [Candidatus Woesearchaeota archaeon]